MMVLPLFAVDSAVTSTEIPETPDAPVAITLIALGILAALFAGMLALVQTGRRIGAGRRTD